MHETMSLVHKRMKLTKTFMSLFG